MAKPHDCKENGFQCIEEIDDIGNMACTFDHNWENALCSKCKGEKDVNGWCANYCEDET